MTEDQNQIETSSDEDEIPTFAEAVKERKKDIASLRYRRRQLAFSRYPELAIHDSDELFRFVLYELSVDAIKVIGPRRPIDEKKLAALKASIKLIGLQTPITVRMQKSKFVLVTGWYRLTAVKQLGKATISCFCSQIDDEMDRYLWQRAENVIRAEPRVLERAEYINEMRVAILQQEGQVAPPGGHQPKNAGIKKAAKALGFTKEEVRRSKRIAEMVSPEAKAEARKLGLDDNQGALLQIAKLPPNAQCTAVTAIVEAQRAARARLASRAVAVASKKAAAKIQAIEAEITKKNDTLHTLKTELTEERERLDEVHGDLAAAYVNNALISGLSIQVADEEGIQAVPDESLSTEDEASFAAVVEAWNKARELKAKLANASPMVLERYIAMVRSWAAQEYKKRKSKEAEESDSCCTIA
jgi:hypothetical protein